MARNFTKTADLGFELNSWEATVAESFTPDSSLHPRRCDHPDCRAWFTPSKPWARFCCAACRQRDVDEHRRIGHLLAAPTLAAREGKHAPRNSRAGALSTLGRTWADQLVTAWREARARRAAQAEERHPQPLQKAA